MPPQSSGGGARGTTVVALLVTAVIILTLSNARIRRESAAKDAALQARKVALNEKDEALGKVWLYRGLYEMDGGQVETLRNFDKAIALAPHNAGHSLVARFYAGRLGSLGGGPRRHDQGPRVTGKLEIDCSRRTRLVRVDALRGERRSGRSIRRPAARHSKRSRPSPRWTNAARSSGCVP